MPSKPPGFRITISQLLLLGMLVALLVGVGAAAWRCSQYGTPRGVCVSPDGRLAAVWFEDGKLQVWDMASKWPRRRPLDATLSPGIYEWDRVALVDERTLALYDDLDASASRRHPRVEVWDVRENRREGEIAFDPSDSLLVYFVRGGRCVRVSALHGTVEFWDLKTRQPLRSLKLEGYTGNAEATADGSRLFRHDGYLNDVEVLSAETGEKITSVDVNDEAYALHVSPSGSHVAVSSVMSGHDSFDGGQFFLPTSTVELIDVESGRVVSRVELESYPSQLLFSPDGSRYLYVVDGQHSQLRSVKDGELVSRLQDATLREKQYAFTSDGKQLIGASSQAITLWDADSGKRVRTIWRRGSTLNALLFGGGFLAWAIAWGLLSRKGRAAAGHASTGEAADSPASAAPLLPPPSRGRAPSLVRSLALLGVVCALGAFLLSFSLADTWPARVAITVGGGLGLLLAAFGAAVAYAMLTELFAKQYRPQLGRAVQVSGQQGRARQIGRFTTWFVGPSQLEPVLDEEITLAERQFEQLLGPFEFRWPGAILGFETHRQLERYAGRRLPLAGVYYGWFRKQMVLCESYGQQNLIDPRRTLRSLLGYHLLLEFKGFWLPPWVQGVVGTRLIGDDTDSQGLAAAQRRLRRELQAGAGPGNGGPMDGGPMNEWLQMGRQQLARIVLRNDDLAAAHALTRSQDLSRSLAAYLFSDESRREHFRRFVLELSRKSDVEQLFRERFGFGFETLVEHWYEWLGNQDVDVYPPPPAWLQREMSERTIPRLFDSEVSEQEKLRAVHYLGAAGYREPLEPLLDMRSSASPALRGEITWAIEAILGRELRDEDEASFRSSLKQSSVASADELSDEPLEAILVPEEASADPESSGVPESSGGPAVHESERIVSAPAAAGHAGSPTAWEAPLVPSGLRQVRGFMFVGGVTALVVSHLFLFESGFWWVPTVYYGILVGIVSVARSVGRATRRLHLTSILQILNIVNCDAFNAMLGIIELILLRGRAVREYLGTVPVTEKWVKEK